MGAFGNPRTNVDILLRETLSLPFPTNVKKTKVTREVAVRQLP